MAWVKVKVLCRELEAVKRFVDRCFSGCWKRLSAMKIFAVGSAPWKTLFMVSGDLVDIASLEFSVAGGILIGWMRGDEFVPSPWFFEELAKMRGSMACAALVAEQGVKAFLYGNDVLVASVLRIYEPFPKGSIVAVVDASDGRVIGVGRAAMDGESIEKAKRMGRMLSVAIINVFDLGVLLRDERALIDFKRARLKFPRN